MNVYYIGDCGHFVFLPHECQTCKGNGAAEPLYKRIEELSAEMARVKLENAGLREALSYNKEAQDVYLSASEEIQKLQADLIGQEHRLGTQVDILKRENYRLQAALDNIIVLHNNGSTNKTCCEMADIARAALEGK